MTGTAPESPQEQLLALQAEHAALQLRHRELQRANEELQRLNQRFYDGLRDLRRPAAPGVVTAVDDAAVSQAHAAAMVTLSEVLPQGIFRTDAHGFAHYANAALCQLVGMTLTQALGFGWMRSVHPADQAAVRAEWKRCVDLKVSGRVEFRLLRSDGRVLEVLGRSAALRDGHGQLLGFVGSIEDISPLRQAQSEVAWSRQVIEHSGDCPVVLTPDGRIEQITAQACSQFGMPDMEQARNSDWLLWWEPKAHDSIVQALESARAGVAASFEARSVTAAGPGKWWSTLITPLSGPLGQPVSLLAVARDVTLLRQREDLARTLQQAPDQDAQLMLGQRSLAMASANELLSHSMAQARALYQSAPCGYHSLDAQGLIVNINDTELGWLGYRRDELVGRMNYAQLLDDDSRQRFAAALQALKAEGSILEIEYTLCRKDGSRFPALLTATVVRDGAGQFVRTQTTVFDISRRKQAEDALRQSEQFLHRLANAAHGRLYYVDLDEVCRFVNQAYEQTWNRPTSFVIGQRIRDFVTPRTYEVLTPYLELARSGKPVQFEYTSDEPSHSDRHHSVSLTPDVRDGQVAGIFMSVHEVTELRRAERAAVENLRFLRMVTDNIPARIGYYDRDQICRFANKSYEKIFGLSLEQIIGRPLREVVSARLYQTIKPNVDAVLQGQVQQFETSHTDRSGLVHFADVSFIPDLQEGAVRGVFTSITDTSERRRAEEALRRNQQFLSLVADNIPVLMAYYDKDLICRYANRHYLNQPIRDPARVVGSHIQQNLPPVIWARAAPRVAAVLRGEPQQFENHDDRHGTDFDVFYVPDLRDGEVVGFFSRVDDITPRKKLEQQMRELNRELGQRVEQLQSANRELEAFSYSVSHDLRSPLRHIVGHIELLKDLPELQLDAQALQRFDAISASARQMGQLIDGLLRFARLGRAALTLVAVDFAGVVAHHSELLDQQERGRPIMWCVAALPVVRGDAVLLNEVWANLLDNAVKYTRRCAHARIEIGWERDAAGQLNFHVQDNGVGFDPLHAPKLFGMFQRLHHLDEFEGTGIGLALTQRIIERHGGRIWADSQPGTGSRFSFSLPEAPL